MNWGYKIMLVIICFILAMSGMVCVAFKQTNEMIDSDYYGKELRYQELINAAHNLNSVSNSQILIQKENKIFLEIPMGTFNEFKEGKIEFLRNSDQSKDKLISFIPDQNGAFSLSVDKFSNGMYKSRIKWTNGSKDYYREQNIMISK